MPATHPSKDLRPLCHEHLLEMTLNRRFSNNGGDATQAPTYGCTEPACLVHYNIYHGYFMPGQDENRDELAMLPKVRCFLDGVPMYLAEISPKKRSFRLWACPQCGARRTNEGGLVGLASQEIQDLDRETTAQSEPTTTGRI
jgi:hypothetical protein